MCGEQVELSVGLNFQQAKNACKTKDHNTDGFSLNIMEHHWIGFDIKVISSSLYYFQ